jgi:hypothetical protein
VTKSPKRRTPTKSRTPVIAGRVPELLHQKIKAAAKKSGRTMSDELAYRAEMSFGWEKVFADFEQAKKQLAEQAKKLSEEIEQGHAEAAEAALTRWGWTSVLDIPRGGKVWLPPGRLNLPKSGWVDPDKPSPPLPRPKITPEPWVNDLDDAINRKIEQALERIVNRAVKAALNKEGGK